MRLVQLDIPPRPEFVSLARLVVSSIADDRYELDDDRLDNLKLAVSEACTRVIENASTPGEYVAINCDGADNRLDVEVADWSTQQSAISVDEVGPSFGLPLIGSLVDEVTVDQTSIRPILRMTLYCSRAEEL